MKSSLKMLCGPLAGCVAALGMLLPNIAPAAGKNAISPQWFNIPLHFEANAGQAPAGVQFLARGPQQSFFITPSEILINLTRVDSPAPAMREKQAEAIKTVVQTRSVRLQFVGANPKASVTGGGEFPGKINYLIGNEPSRWHAGVSTFSKVQVEGLYPDVDLLCYGNQHQLEYDFTVAAGTDPSVIAIHFDGADQIEIRKDGSLVLKLGDAEIAQPRPVLYQVVNGTRKNIQGGYRLKDATTVTFSIGEYDRSLPLVIDPILTYSTFFGGTGNDTAWAVALDTNGFVYIAGETLSPQFTTNFSGSFQTNMAGGTYYGDAFVAKFSNDASNLVYFTYLGGNNDDSAYGLAVDNAGSAYLTGFTQSTNFPVFPSLAVNINGSTSYTNLNNPYNTIFKGYASDAFITKLQPNGAGLVYSLYLGGNDFDVGYAVALDPLKNAYVTGNTFSTNYPTVNPLQSRWAGSNDVFVTKISFDGTTVPYSTYFGGTNYDQGISIVADASQNAYVTGFTYSTNFYSFTNGGFGSTRTLNHTSATNPPIFCADGFVTKFDTLSGGANSLVYSAILGGTNDDAGLGITLDSGNNVYTVGFSRSYDFTNFNNQIPGSILTNGNPTVNGPFQDAFLAKLDTNGNNAFTAVFGGTSNDRSMGVGLDSAGDIFVAGHTSSYDFPTNSANGLLRADNSGGEAAYVMAVNANCSALLYSVYLGGSGDDAAYAMATDAAGNAYVVGRTVSGDFPVTNTPPSSLKGGTDIFLTKISLPPPLSLNFGMDSTNVYLSWSLAQPEYTQFRLQQNTNPILGGIWTNVLQLPVMTNGSNQVTLSVTNSGPYFRLQRQ